MCKITVLVSKQVDKLIEVIPYDHIPKNYACMTTKVIMDVYTGRTFYITSAKIGKRDVNFPMQQNVGDI